MQTVLLLIGVPASGKTWVTKQLGHKYDLCRHDDYMPPAPKGAYVAALIERSKTAQRPIMAEAPFSISEIKNPLEAAGVKVIPIFILEEMKVLFERYLKRNHQPYPAGHITRQATYQNRRVELKAFGGTSTEALEHLKRL